MSNYILDIVKNPIFIGIFGAIITYSYFYWTDNNNEKAHDNKKKKNSNTTYHILVSLCVGLILGFGSYIYFDMAGAGQGTNSNSNSIANENSSLHDTPIIAPKTNSLNVPSKSLVIPQSLPDVFIETFDQ